jgi:tRNA A-37 threonylcarbamoyl transferase component Bud32
MFRPTTFGKYYLTERLAVGGMAEIYKAKLMGVGGFERPMVVKQILPQLARNQAFVDMFIDEARIAVSLTHGNIVQVYELGKLEGIYFISMEYVQGKDLAEILEHAFKRKRLPSWELALFVAIEVLHGLDYAHRRKDAYGRCLGIVHRDVSPQNILVSIDGEVKIADFGIAKAAHKVAETQSGVIKGKFAYMSPEQASGEAVDARSDLFSVGVLLFEMLTGERLFQGRNDAESIERVRTARVPAPSTQRSGLPAELDPLLLRALERDPRDRYPDANSFQLDLSRFLYARGAGGTPHQLAAYLRELFADIAAEPLAAALAAPEPAKTRVTAETDALIDDLRIGKARTEASTALVEAPRRPVGLNTQILNTETDELLDELVAPPPSNGAAALAKPPAPVPVAFAAPAVAPPRDSVPRSQPRPPPLPAEQMLGLLENSAAQPVALTAPAGARSGVGLWLATIGILVALLGAVLLRTGLLRRSRRVAAAAAAPASPTPVAPPVRYGTLELGAQTDGAKVFLHVGKTPVVVPHLDRGQTQELLIEQESFWPQTALVSARSWQGGTAALNVPLVPASAAKPAPPSPPGGDQPSDAYGDLKLDSTPSGADCWLLVGFTPTMHMEGLRVDRGYRFKLTAQHHLPTTIEVKPGDWKDDGLHTAYRTEVTLPEDPKDPIPVLRVTRKPKPHAHTLRF